MRGKAADRLHMILKIMAGSLLYAAGFQLFLYPNDIVPGGVTGIAVILNRMTSLPVGSGILLLNLPLFFFAWKKYGRQFIMASLAGTVLSGAAVDLMALLPAEITHEPLLAAVYGGIIKGAGLGIIYHAGATTGGADLAAWFLRRRFPYLNLGTLLLALDVAVIAAFAVIFRKYDSAMYALICMFIAARVIDLVLYGAAGSKVCCIITDESRGIGDAIMASLQRGVTFLHGEGGWTGRQKDILLCVIRQSQITELKRIVRSLDEQAFVIVSDSREVFGNGFRYLGSED